MIFRSSSVAFAALSFLPSAVFAATFLAPPVSVGENLQIESRIALSEAAPKGGLAVRITSADPSRMLLALQPEDKGAAEITVRVYEGQRSSPEFQVQGLAGSGVVKYNLTAEGITPGAGEVSLTPSGLVVKGPGEAGATVRSTPRSWATKLHVLSVQYDVAGEVIGTQKVRGGFAARAKLSSSDPAIANPAQTEVAIPGGEGTATTELRPVKIGTAEIRVEGTGFSVHSSLQRVPVAIYEPGISLLDEMHLGNKLQITASLTLGELAPPGGVPVTLVSKDPSRLRLAVNPKDKGSESIVVVVPEGQNVASYTVQGFAAEGTATYTATAPGFRSKEATLPLVPSGVIITGATGLPDEIEVLRPEMPLSPNGFIASLSDGKPSPVIIYTVRLDPKTNRAADLTTQHLRADLNLTVMLRNENPEIGQLSPSVTVKGGEGQASGTFIPKAPGVADLTYVTPEGYTRTTNADVLKAHISK